MKKLDKYLLIFLFLSLVLGNFFNLIIFNYLKVKIDIRIYDISVFFIFLASIFISKYRIKKVDLLIFVFFFVNLVVLVINTKFLLSYSSIFYLIRLVIYLFSYPFFIKVFKHITLYSFVKNLMLVILPTYLLIFLFNPNLNVLGYDPHQGRLYGPFLDPNYYSIYIISLSILMFSNIKKVKKVDIFIFILSFISNYLTYSRVGLVCLLLVIFLIAVKYRKFYFFTFLIGFISLVMVNINYIYRILFIEGNFTSFTYRFLSYLDGITILEKNRFIVGFNNIKMYKIFLTSSINMSSTFTDSLYINLLLIGGIPLLVIFLYFFIVLVKRITIFNINYLLFILVIVLSSNILNVFFHPYFLLLTVLVFSTLKYNKNITIKERNKMYTYT